MSLRSEANRLYWNGVEVREWACHQDGGPAHPRDITCVGASPTEKRLISIDQEGKAKIWDPSLPRLEQRIWLGSGLPTDACAINVTDDGKRFAIAVGLVVTVYDVSGNNHVKQEKVSLEPSTSIIALQWLDSDSFLCKKEGAEVTVKRQPLWAQV